jgi:hypothetical protein
MRNHSKRKFLDGYRGALIAQMAALAVRIKYRKIGAAKREQA